MPKGTQDTAELNEDQRREALAGRFYDLSESARAEEARLPQEEQYQEALFLSVGREAAQGNYSGAQRILEGGVRWNDDLRDAAVEMNELDQERRGEKPLSFEEAQETLGGYARDFEKISKEPGGKQSDIENAMAIDNIVADMFEPGTESIDAALRYIESALKSKSAVADTILKSEGPLGKQAPEFIKDWQEKRAIRDALYQEKQKRAEQIRQTQGNREGLAKGREATAIMLEQAFTQAGISEDAASRQEFLAKAGAMSAEELRFLDSALNKAAREAMRSGDPKLLEGLLLDLSTKSFRRKDVEAKQKKEDQKGVDEIKREIESPEPGREKKSEISVYEKVTDENFEQYREKNEVKFNDLRWRIGTVNPDGTVLLIRDITIEEAVSLAERAKDGVFRIGGVNDVNTPSVKEKARMASRDELISSGQWIVAPRSPNNPERQKEVNAVKALQQRLVSGEFSQNIAGGYELLEDVFDRYAKKLNQERQEYEKLS
ncbi:MAG: hypothetical protein Q8P82_01870 [bacterium]|nr:hypothetical protein [bacterium]